jgi:hypothetical protein
VLILEKRPDDRIGGQKIGGIWFSFIRSDFFDSFLSLMIFVWMVESYLDKESERTMNAHSTDSGFVEWIRGEGRRTDRYGEEAGRPKFCCSLDWLNCTARKPRPPGRQKSMVKTKKCTEIFIIYY